MSVSIIILARDHEGEKVLERCLRSLYERETPIAEEVIVYEGGCPSMQVQEIVRGLAEGFPGLRFEAARDDLPMVNGGVGDFAAFRNAAFALAKHEWVGYLDADDVWPTPAKISSTGPLTIKRTVAFRDALAALPPHVHEVWMPYHYAIDGTGKAIDKFDTPRFVRWKAGGYYWRNRTGGCHEMLMKMPGAPEGQRTCTGDSCYIEHYPCVPQKERRERNAKLYEASARNGLLDWGLHHFLGREAEARNEWKEAMKHDVAAIFAAKADHEARLSFACACRVSRTSGNHLDAFRMAAEGHARFPSDRTLVAALVESGAALSHPTFEHWYGVLTSTKAEGGNLESKNLYESDVWPHIAAAREFMRREKPSEAADAARRALAAAPYDALAKEVFEAASRAQRKQKAYEGLKSLVSYVRETQDQGAVAALAQGLSGSIYEDFCGSMPRDGIDKTFSVAKLDDVAENGYELLHMKRVEDAKSYEAACSLPVVLGRRTDLTIHIYAPCGAKPWRPFWPEERGAGGSEEQLVYVARMLRQMGHKVVVYSMLEGLSCVDHGCIWRPLAHFRPDEHRDVLVAYREASALLSGARATLRVAWFQDLVPAVHMAWRTAGGDPRIDFFVGVSVWHKTWLESERKLDPTRVLVAPNCPDEGDGESLEVPRRPASACYISNPDRGLLTLLKLWPRIRARAPEATLDVAYGWETYDAMSKLYPHLVQQKAQILELMTQPGITAHERLNISDLRALLRRTAVLAYPCNYDETSCRALQRAISCGVTPVFYGRGALPETSGGLGTCVAEGDEAAFVEGVIDAMVHPKIDARVATTYFDSARRRTYAAWQSIVEKARTEVHA